MYSKLRLNLIYSVHIEYLLFPILEIDAEKESSTGVHCIYNSLHILFTFLSFSLPGIQTHTFYNIL